MTITALMYSFSYLEPVFLFGTYLELLAEPGKQGTLGHHSLERLMQWVCGSERLWCHQAAQGWGGCDLAIHLQLQVKRHRGLINLGPSSVTPLPALFLPEISWPYISSFVFTLSSSCPMAWEFVDTILYPIKFIKNQNQTNKKTL